MLDNLSKPIPELDKLTTAELKTIQDQLIAADANLKKQKATFEALMLRRFEKDARAAYVEAKKDTGTVNFTAPGSNLLTLKVDVDKKVEWDQAKLSATFNKMKPEDARHYAKVEYKVEEAKYKAAPPAVQADLKGARTVKPGKMKFTFINGAVDEMQEAA